MVGAILSGFSADAISRRRTKIVSGSVYVVGALGSAAAQSPTELIAARFVLGVAVGTASFVSPLYISELAPKRIRGGVTSFNQLMVVSGIFAAYIVNWALGGVSGNWRWMLGLGAVPGLALAIGMYFQPFSPRWLVGAGREEEAREVLQRARGDEDEVEEELEEIKREAEEEGSLRDLLAPGVRAMVAVGLAMADRPAADRRQHRHLLRADDPQADRPQHRLGDHPGALGRDHQRDLHRHRDPDPRPGRAPAAADRGDDRLHRLARRRSASSSPARL